MTTTQNPQNSRDAQNTQGTQGSQNTQGSQSTQSTSGNQDVQGPRDAQEWRGIAAERQEEVRGTAAMLLRRRSRALLGSLLQPHRRALWWLLALIVTENLAALAGPYLIGYGIDHGIPPLAAGQGPGTLLLIVAGFAAAATLQVVTQRSFLLHSGRIGQQVVLDLRQRVFVHFQRLSMAFHEHYTSGRVISRQTSDVDTISDFLEEGIDGVVMALLSAISIGIALLLLDLPSALIVAASFVPVLALTLWFRRESAKAYRATREAIVLVIVQVVETLGGIRAVQAFRREGRNDQIFGEFSEQYRQASQRSMRLMAVFMPGTKLVQHLATAGVLVVGGERVLHGQLQLGVLTSILIYLRRFYDPFQDVAQFFNAFQSAAAALEKLSGVLEEPFSVPDAERPVPLPVTAEGVAQGAVQFEHVEFGYRDRPPVLPAFDLTIPAGQTVALVGATGAGKTTVARLLARFYDPRRGRVLLDGIDLRDLAEADLHRAVVTVTQEGYLFTGTVADNIAFGRPDADRTEIEAAARLMGADDVFRALPEGYDTAVRSRGSRLSAGQRQLVSFARAFLADPAVLILDEATSSLDIPSERLVQRALRTILADRTAIIIAHRLATVEIADRVLVLDAGRIVEDGAPAQLAAGHGPYARLVAASRAGVLEPGAG